MAFRPLQRYFEFSGRSGRAEYWQWILLTTVVGWIARAFDAASTTDLYTPHGNTATAALAMGTLIPSVSVGVRRLHDRNLPGGWLYGGALAATAFVFMVIFGKYIQEQSGSDLVLAIGALMLLPWLAMGVLLIIQLVKPGDTGANRYGEPDAYVPSAASADLFSKIAAPITPRSPDSAPDDPLARLERLALLRQQGHLSEEEFATQKRALLGGAVPSASDPSGDS